MYEKKKKFGWLRILADVAQISWRSHLDPPNPTGTHIWKASPLPPSPWLSHNMAKKLEGKGRLNRCPLVRQSMTIERVQSCSFVILLMGNHKVLQEYINP